MDARHSGRRANARLAATAAAIAATALLLGAAPAMATVTGSTITSMTTADGFVSNPVVSPIFSGYDDDAATAQVTVGGTTTTDDNNVADTVEVRCYYGGGGNYNTLVTGVAVGADGTFNATGPAGNLYNYTCRLAAVPSTYTNPLDYSKFSGPIYGIGYQENQPYKITSGPNAGKQYDYFSDAHQLKGAIDVLSSGDCGIDYTSSINAALYDNYQQYGFADCAAWLNTYSGDGFGRSEVQVDGKNAYNSSGADYLSDDGNSHTADHNGNFPGLTDTNTIDPLTGNMTSTESEQLVDCGSAAFPPTAQCDQGTNATQASFHDTGVHFDRTYQTGVDGQRVTITDTYTSTDGAAHALDVEYDNYSYEDTQVFDFPGSSGFNYYYSGDSVDLPAQAVGTIYTQDAYYPSAEDYSRPSSVTYTTQPDRAFFHATYAFVLQYRRTIPAGGSTSITHVYNYSTTPEGIRALAGQTQNAASPPAIAITSPANGSASASHDVVVSGTASDDSGAPSVAVNGIATPVQPDGSWSRHLDLPTGGNTITAVATDAAGNTAQAQTTVNVAIAQCTVPKVTGMTTAQATAALTGAGCKVGAQTKATSKTVKAGSVIAQSIPAGLVGSLGLPVDLRISLGKFAGATLASKSIKLNGRSLVVTVKCGSSPVQTGTVKLRTTSGKKKTLGSAAFSCPKGKKRTVHFTISKTSAKALKKQKKTKATAFIVARNSTGDSIQKTGKLTIKG